MRQPMYPLPDLRSSGQEGRESTLAADSCGDVSARPSSPSCVAPRYATEISPRMCALAVAHAVARARAGTTSVAEQCVRARVRQPPAACGMITDFGLCEGGLAASTC